MAIERKNIMENKENYVEMEINLKDLLIFILGKWKFFIVTGLTGVVLFTGISYYLNIHTYKRQQNSLELNGTTLLSNEESVHIEAVVILREQLKNTEKYLNESLLMHLNANEKPEGLLKYSFNGVDDENLIDNFVAYVKSDSCLERLKEQLGTKLPRENQYIRELISVEAVNEWEKREVSIIISHEDQEACEAMGTALKEIIENCFIEHMGQLDNKITLSLESYNIVVDSKLSDTKLQRWNEWRDLTTQLSSLENAMTNDELLYYNNLINGNTEKPELEKSVVEKPRLISKKSIVLGGALGVALGVLCWGAIYILSGTLHNIDDVECGLGLSGLGTIKGNPSKRQGEIYDKKMKFIVQNITSIAEKNNIEELTVISSRSFKEGYGKLIKDLEGHFSSGLKVTFCEDINESAESIRQISKEKNVILLEFINRSKVKKVTDIVRLCKIYTIQILGVVLIE